MKTGRTFICWLFILSLSCAKISGEFAFKTDFSDSFRKPLRMPEIDANKKTEWIYSFKNNFEGRSIHVFIMKKEIIWIEIAAYEDFAGNEKMTIGGVIEGYAPGQYRIMLIEFTSKKTIIVDEIVFMVYSEDDLEEDEERY
ncbi:MAG: hypothetical protein FWG92_06740 [Leptospirales bacterium]|nr:hypothetical protein [Leptospirales bacterium]